MMQTELDRIRGFLERQLDIHVDEPFHTVLLPSGSVAEARLTITRRDRAFTFRVELPKQFPLYGLLFYYQGTEVARHLLREGYVCVSSAFTSSFDQKLEWDFEAIREWLDKYVLTPGHEHYEYLPIDRHGVFMLFNEREEPLRSQHGDFGRFTFMELPRGLEGLESTHLALNLGQQPAGWSMHYTQVNQEKAVEFLKATLLASAYMGVYTEAQIDAMAGMFQRQPWPKEVPEIQIPQFLQQHIQRLAAGRQGFYFYMDREPLGQDGQVIRTLGQLNQLMGDAANAELAKLNKEQKPANILDPKFAEYSFPIYFMLGYPLPGKNEIHWELILYPREQPTGTGKEKRKMNQITWGRSINASYDRFFGRGRLHDSICNASILILGLGALGSNLAHALARGGAKNIALSDFDHVEAGNLCRSTYKFDELHRDKSIALMDQLMQISPFVTITPITVFGIEYLEDQDRRQAFVDAFSKYEIIIDCTANDGLGWMLDQMNLPTTVINLSITDQANHLLAVTNAGREAIVPAKRQILAALGQTHKEPTFYEGQGCWHPTFLASYADINMLLQHWVADANHRLSIGRSWITTVLETKRGDFGLRVVKREDV